MDVLCCARGCRPLKQFVWYTVQSGIVALFLYVDHINGGQRPGLALMIGIGMALSFTVVVHLIGNGLRRLWDWLHRRAAASKRLGGIVRHEETSERLLPGRRPRLGEVSENLPRLRVGDHPRKLL